VTTTLTPAEVLDAGKERPILFSAPMVRAILAGTKTQTRRIVKPQPEYDADERWPGWKWPSHQARSMLEISEIPSACPYGRRGDRLWVRETHAQFAVGNRSGVAPQCVAYRATCDEDGGFDYVNNGDEIMRLKVTKWTPAIYMPRWASRITLEVTRVRVERLHDISEEDARAEGVDEIKAQVPTARDAFSYLWRDINGAESWRANPWVWVISFRRCGDAVA
jgi:hypothetical protein